MQENPLLSIITVNLNNLEGLKKTIQSVIEQTWKDFEYIVIDGGSEDGSKEYIEANSEKIDSWVSEPDKGIYNAMNKGIKIAAGEYLLFLNSGDWLYDEKVLKIVSSKLKGYDVIYGNMIKVFSENEKVLDKGINGKEMSLKLFIEGTINHSSSFINKKVFSNYGYYDENLRIVADWKLFLIALGLNNSNVNYINFPISYFDMLGISNSDMNLRNKERNLVLKEYVPDPIYSDYLKLKDLEKKMNTSRFKKFIISDQKKISRKLHSLIFKLFS